MTLTQLRQLRLQNQHISSTTFTKPGEIVSHMLAIQAQVYPMAKWAIGLRLRHATGEQIDDAFNAGKIIRTHVMRPTWHFVSPQDIRWLLKLTGPRIRAFNKTYYARHDLDSKIFKKCNDIFLKSLEGGSQLTRVALQSELAKAKIKAQGIRLAFIMMQAELDGIICSGAKQGNQFTYALLEERVASTKEMSQQESLFAIAERYFNSRGPATLKDFSWWSGLSITECKEATSMLDHRFLKEKINGQEYLYSEGALIKTKLIDRSFYMPDYDEYGIAYKDRTAIIGERISEKSHAALGYPHVLVIDGIISGTWKITSQKTQTKVLETKVSRDVLQTYGTTIKKAGKRFSEFTQLSI
jgi:hypothetical protein